MVPSEPTTPTPYPNNGSALSGTLIERNAPPNRNEARREAALRRAPHLLLSNKAEVHDCVILFRVSISDVPNATVRSKGIVYVRRSVRFQWQRNHLYTIVGRDSSERLTRLQPHGTVWRHSQRHLRLWQHLQARQGGHKPKCHENSVSVQVIDLSCCRGPKGSISPEELDVGSVRVSIEPNLSRRPRRQSDGCVNESSGYLGVTIQNVKAIFSLSVDEPVRRSK